MSRFLVGLFASSAILVLASCDDDPEGKTLTPTEPGAAPAIAPATALSIAPAKVKGSSVCAAYLRDRTKLLASLEKAPEDAALLKRASSLAEVITDACN